MKVSFGLSLGIGLGVFAAVPTTGDAQCFAPPRRVVAQSYVPPVQYVQPSQVVYPAQPMPLVAQGQVVVPSQPQTFVQGQPIQQTSNYRPITTDTHDVRHTQHRLWDDHVVLTRLFLVSALADLPDKTAAAERLQKNQVEIGNAVKPRLGDAAGDKLAGLLKTHTTLAADFIAAAKASDATKKADTTTKLQANADEISAFLTGANPQAFPDQVVKGMMREHLDLFAAEVDARVKQDWSGDTAAFEKARTQIKHMADLVANGLGAPTSTTIVPATTIPVQSVPFRGRRR